MFDTHAHLNFAIFSNNLDQVIADSREAGVRQILVPGTEFISSKKAVEVAQNYEGIYASVGIHPHHLHPGPVILNDREGSNIESLLIHPKVVAVGETGLDRHKYLKTKHQNYQINEEFINLQKDSLIKHIKLAIKYKKSLILHNREATDELITIITQNWDNSLSYRSVLHCCEPDIKLLEFAKKFGIYIGVDGDITYSKTKQNFLKQVPLELLVLETDSPFLIPEPLKSQKIFPNTPINLPLILEFTANLLDIPKNHLGQIILENSTVLCSI